jgi:hypothetical protein
MDISQTKNLLIETNKNIDERFDYMVKESELMKRSMNLIEKAINESIIDEKEAKEMLTRIDVGAEDVKKEIGGLSLQLILTWKEVNLITNKLFDIESKIENEIKSEMKDEIYSISELVVSLQGNVDKYENDLNES